MSPEFSTDLLALYYDRIFPYDKFEQWLSYDQGSEYLYRREFSFTLENDQYLRYKAFRSGEELKAGMKKLQPHKIDLGAVFKVSPADKAKVQDSEFQPVARELVFDVDLTDYDEIRTCCEGAKICSRCWKFMVAAVKVLDAGLREDFGFEHLLWVYSGRRGIHCWVADEIARNLTNEARSAIVAYFSLVEGNENTNRKVTLKDPLHPSLARAKRILEPMFEDFVLAEKENGGQGVLSSPDSWTQLLKMVPEEAIRAELSEKWSNARNSSTPRAKWKELKDTVDRALPSLQKRSRGEDKKRAFGMRTCVTEILFAYTYPRLDANVSKQRNHLLKIPFAVHPKTGRVCVPIDERNIDSFDPFQVPTLASIEKDLNEKKEKEKTDGGVDGNTLKRCSAVDTSLAVYVDLFDRKFLVPMQKSFAKVKREHSERNAAETGNW